MTDEELNREIARKVMGWDINPDDDSEFDWGNGYIYMDFLTSSGMMRILGKMRDDEIDVDMSTDPAGWYIWVGHPLVGTKAEIWNKSLPHAVALAALKAVDK